jgi:hypothetical protein
MTRGCKDVCGLAHSSSHLLMLRLLGTPYFESEFDQSLIDYVVKWE